MGNIVLAGATSGTTTLAPTDAVTTTLTLPSASGTVLTSVSSLSASLLSGQVPAANAVSGSVIQLVTGVPAYFSTTSATFVTAQSLSITPKLSTSTIYGIFYINLGTGGTGVRWGGKIQTNSSGSYADLTSSCDYMGYGTDEASMDAIAFVQPSIGTTSTVTYQLQVYRISPSCTVYAPLASGTNLLTLMEIKA